MSVERCRYVRIVTPYGLISFRRHLLRFYSCVLKKEAVDCSTTLVPMNEIHGVMSLLWELLDLYNGDLQMKLL
jgi:hypothetical protein